MRESDAQMLITVFGGEVMLAGALGIKGFKEETQRVILERFCECVFKRVLLKVSEENIIHVIETFESHRAAGRSFDFFVASLEQYVPDMNMCVKEEIEKAIAQFRISAAVA